MNPGQIFFVPPSPQVKPVKLFLGEGSTCPHPPTDRLYAWDPCSTGARIITVNNWLQNIGRKNMAWLRFFEGFEVYEYTRIRLEVWDEAPKYVDFAIRPNNLRSIFLRSIWLIILRWDHFSRRPALHTSLPWVKSLAHTCDNFSDCNQSEDSKKTI